jgi:hypothetical protein
MGAIAWRSGASEEVSEQARGGVLTERAGDRDGGDVAVARGGRRGLERLDRRRAVRADPAGLAPEGGRLEDVERARRVAVGHRGREAVREAAVFRELLVLVATGLAAGLRCDTPGAILPRSPALCGGG